MKILVVDDQQIVLEMTADMLTLNGYETLTAASAEEALQTLEKNVVDLVLSDIQMPGMDGTQFRRKAPGKKFIFMSGFFTEDQRQRMDGVPLLSKPFATKDLIEMVEKTLGG